METTHRYGIFMSWFYGKTIEEAMLTQCIKTYSVNNDYIRELFPMNEDIKAGSFCIFYREEGAYHLDLMIAVVDEYINVVFVYDTVDNLLLIYKGLGDPQALFEDYEEALVSSYEAFFDRPFTTEDCVDMRHKYFNPN